MKTVQSTLIEAKIHLSEQRLPSPDLDAEVLLSHILSVDRSWLVAHGDEEIDNNKVDTFEGYTKRRAAREPVAYITSHKEFYGRDFMVTPDVLIPRPETEDLVELALKYAADTAPQRIIDVGCGSGCVGITLKLERPALDVTLSDISEKALAIAQQNATRLRSDVKLTRSDLLLSPEIQKLRSKCYFDLIVANLPYVSRAWKVSPELAYEPDQALFAKDNGLELIKRLIEQSLEYLHSNGQLILEADPEQHADIIEYAAKRGFKHIATLGYALALSKLAK